MVYEVDLGIVRGPVGAIGPSGPAGATGAPGPCPSIHIGTVTTLPTGSDARVTRRAGSADSAPILDFALPRGGGGDMELTVYDPHQRHQDIFAYCDAASGKRGATLIVAAADSVDSKRADFHCSGANDQFTINRAISSLPAQGGCVQLLEGTYYLDAANTVSDGGRRYLLNLSADQGCLRGQGRSTVLRLVNQAALAESNCTLLLVSGAGCSVSDLVLDGNSGSNAPASIEGLRLGAGATQGLISRLEFYDCNGQAALALADRAAFERCYALCCGSGITISGDDGRVEQCLVEQCAVGIRVNGGSAAISHNRLEACLEAGITYSQGSLGMICHNILINQPLGISLLGSHDVLVNNNIVRRAADPSAGYAAGENSLQIKECQRVLAINNWLRGKGASVDSNSSSITEESNYIS